MSDFGLSTGSLFRWITRAGQALLIAAVVCFSLGATDSTEHFNKVGGKLMCTCGCAQSLLGCDHVGCTYRGEEMDMLRTGIASGQNDSLILQSFVQKYGATVLAAPTTQGFDLVAWIMPFAVAIAGLIGAIFLVKNWSKKERLAMAVAHAKGPRNASADAAMHERIRRETGIE